jgi:hypothetical protein
MQRLDRVYLAPLNCQFQERAIFILVEYLAVDLITYFCHALRKRLKTTAVLVGEGEPPGEASIHSRPSIAKYLSMSALELLATAVPTHVGSLAQCRYGRLNVHCMARVVQCSCGHNLSLTDSPLVVVTLLVNVCFPGVAMFSLNGGFLCDDCPLWVDSSRPANGSGRPISVIDLDGFVAAAEAHSAAVLNRPSWSS